VNKTKDSNLLIIRKHLFLQSLSTKTRLINLNNNPILLIIANIHNCLQNSKIKRDQAVDEDPIQSRMIV
jgi:hypothetical protein